MSPASANLPKWANGISVAKFDLTAGSQDVSISSVQLKRVGLGASSVVREVALFSNDSRISKIRTFGSSDDLVDIALSPALVLKAGSTETLTVKVNTEDGANISGLFSVQLTSLTSSANVLGGVQTSAQHEVKNVASATVEVSNDGTVSKPKLGETQAEVKRFKIRNTSTNEDVSISEITFKEDGTIKETTELANVSLYYGSTKLATVASMRDKYVTFKFAPMTIKDGKTERFTIKADIIGGADTNIDFVIENKLDLTATASKVGFVSADIDDLTTQPVDVDAGEVSLFIDEPTSTKIREDKKDITLWGFTLSSKGTVELSRIKFTVSPTSTPGTDLRNVFETNSFKLYDLTNGTKYDLTSATGSLGTWVGFNLSENDLSIIVKSTAKFVVKADTKKSITNFDDYKFRLSLTTASNGLVLKEIVDDKVVSDITPSTLTWKSIEWVEAGLAINVLNQADRISVVGAKAVDVMAFEVESTNESSDLTVRELRVRWLVNGTDNVSNSYVNAVYLYAGETLVAQKSGSQFSAGSVTFNGFEVAVPKNSKKSFYVKADFLDDANNADDTVRFSVTDYQVEDDERTDVYAGTDNATTKDVRNSTRLVTLKWFGSLSLLADAGNDANKNTKSILAWQSVVVYSADVQSINESVKVEEVVFTLTWANVSKINNASLYLGNTLISTNSASDIVFNATPNTTTVTFKNLSNLIVTDSSEELKLQLNTATIGYEKVGLTVKDVLVNSVELRKATWVSSNKDVNNASLTTTWAKEFSIVPVKVTASISKAMSSTDRTAKIKFTVDSGSNSASGSTAKVNLDLTQLTFTAWGTYTWDYRIYVEGQSQSWATATVSGWQLVFNNTALNNTFGQGVISSDETYVIEMVNALTAGQNASLTLIKSWVQYNATNVDNSTGLTSDFTNEIELGSAVWN